MFKRHSGTNYHPAPIFRAWWGPQEAEKRPHFFHVLFRTALAMLLDAAH
jgi:hypothetical protein